MPDQFPGLSAKQRFDAMEAAKPGGPSVSTFQALKDWAHTDAPDYVPPPNSTPAPPPIQPAVNASPANPVDFGQVLAANPPQQAAQPSAPAAQPAAPAVSPSAMPSALPRTGTGGSGMAGAASRYDKDITKSFEAREAANTEAAKVQGQLAAEQARAQDAQMQAIAQTQKQWEDRYLATVAEQDKLKRDIAENPIQADKWWGSRNTGERIAGTIGMILGGIGQAFGGGPNMAKEMIDKAISQDIDAQKANLGRKQTLLGDLMNQGHSLQEAEKLATANGYAVLQGKLANAAYRFGTAKAQAEAQQLNSGLDTERLGLIQDAHHKGAMEAMERQKLAIELAKAGTAGQKPLQPKEVEGLTERIQALKSIDDVERQFNRIGKGSALASKVPGTGNLDTEANSYNDIANTASGRIAGAINPESKNNTALLELHRKGMPDPLWDKKRAKAYFEDQRRQVKEGLRAAISALAAGGANPAQINELVRQAGAAQTGQRVKVVNDKGEYGSVTAAELQAHPNKYRRVEE